MGAKNEKFNIAEKRERKAIKWYSEIKQGIVEINEISEIGSYNTTDFLFTSGNTFCVGEVKIRSFTHDKYPTAVLELDKVMSLMKKGTDYVSTNHQILYYAFYEDDRKLLIFDVKNTPFTLSYKYSPVSSCEDRGFKHKVMAEFKITDAIEIIDIV
jgi:hypothetical protein